MKATGALDHRHCKHTWTLPTITGYRSLFMMGMDVSCPPSVNQSKKIMCHKCVGPVVLCPPPTATHSAVYNIRTYSKYF